MKKLLFILLLFSVTFTMACKEKDKIDPKTGGKIIHEQKGRQIDGGGSGTGGKGAT